MINKDIMIYNEWLWLTMVDVDNEYDDEFKWLKMIENDWRWLTVIGYNEDDDDDDAMFGDLLVEVSEHRETLPLSW